MRAEYWSVQKMVVLLGSTASAVMFSTPLPASNGKTIRFGKSMSTAVIVVDEANTSVWLIA